MQTFDQATMLHVPGASVTSIGIALRQARRSSAASFPQVSLIVRLRNPDEHFRWMQAKYAQVCRYLDVAEMLGVTLPTTTEALQPEAKTNKEPR
jgi:hypothetical protein